MKLTFDDIQILFWTITYILAIVYTLKYKTNIIPYPAILCNFAWELAALLQSGMIGHYVWCAIDAIILILFLNQKNYSKKFKMIWILCLLLVFGIMREVFYFEKGMLYSSYTIDILMAILFCLKIWRDKKGTVLGIVIAATKLIGDFSAWRFYRYDRLVDIIGAIVFVLNICYLISVCVYLGKHQYEEKKS